MTKLSQKERRDKRKEITPVSKAITPVSKAITPMSEQPPTQQQPPGEQILINTLKEIYPGVSVINMTKDVYSTSSLIHDVKQLNELTRDDNNIMIINNVDSVRFNEFYNGYMDFKGCPKQARDVIGEGFTHMLVRAGRFCVFGHSVIDDNDLLAHHIKAQLKLRAKECAICFNEFLHGFKRTPCSNCRGALCSTCFSHYIKIDAGWCPVCRLHMLYHGLRKWPSGCDALNKMFDVFVRRQMIRHIRKHGTFKEAPCAVIHEDGLRI
jgi:hypothetical protein